MVGINRLLQVLALALAGVFLYTALAAGATTEPTTRYTAREIVKIHAHACAEDEYMFIPARYVNGLVAYDTPDKAFCVAIESVRRAPYQAGIAPPPLR